LVVHDHYRPIDSDLDRYKHPLRVLGRYGQLRPCVGATIECVNETIEMLGPLYLVRRLLGVTDTHALTHACMPSDYFFRDWLA